MAFTQGLDLADRIGDDTQRSVLLGNLSVASVVRGQPEEAIAWAEEATRLVRHSTDNPINNLLVYSNLADAYMLLGRQADAEECFEELKRRADLGGNWYLHLAFLLESASFALALGNVQLALSQIVLMEELVRRRKLGLPNRGLYERLRIYRMGRLLDPKEALLAADEVVCEFKGRHNIYYLDAIAVKSWVEALCFDAIPEGTSQELLLFERLGAVGKKRLLTFQGFLKEAEPGRSEEFRGAARERRRDTRSVGHP